MPNLNLLPFWKGDKGDGVQQIADASNPDAGPLDGAEYATVSRGAGVLKTTLTAIAQFARAPLSDANDVDKGAFMVGRGTVTVFSVAELLSARRATDLTYNVRGYYLGSTYGGGPFYYDATRAKSAHNGGTILSPTVPFNGTPAGLANFLDGVGETDPSGSGCFVRDHGYDVFVSWFGAIGDAVRPSAAIPDGDITGTDDTKAVAACRDYMQEIAFQPNLFVGFWGGYRLNFEPNRAYKVVGHNPLGTSRPRSSDADPSGSNYRQNWFIEGNGAFILWQVTAADDCFIESHETFSRQWYKNFSVYACKATGSQGIFYSNVANSGRNATAIHKFERVEVYHVQPSDTVNGLKYMFRYQGDNLGDRLITEQCSFNQFNTFFYSENGEAVGQAFYSTSITSYINNAKFFHLRVHGSGFNFGAGCNILMKGDNQTLFKTEFMPGAETGVNGSSTYMNMSGCRLEGSGGKYQTIAECDFGVLEIEGITMTKGGGLPHIDSNAFISRKGAVIKVANSNVYGRVVSGTPNTSTLRIRRAYSILFDNCSFIGDLGKLLYIEDGAGAIVSWRDAVVGAYQVPPVLVQNTDSRTIGFDGLAVDNNSYVFDGLYPCGMQYGTTPKVQKLQVGRHRTSAQRYYLDNTSYQVLPPYIVITSIKIKHDPIASATMDTLRVKVGTASLDYALSNNVGRNGYELLMPGQTIAVSDNDVFERTIATECRVGGGLWASPSFIAFLEIEWRPAFALNEITTTEVAGIRQTRIVTSSGQGYLGALITNTSGTVALTSSTPANVTSISLTAGVWDVTGNVLFTTAAGDTMTGGTVSVSSTSATHAAAPEYATTGPISVGPAGTVSGMAPVRRMTLAATTTVYLVATGVHSGGTLNSQGIIRATRVQP